MHQEVHSYTYTNCSMSKATSFYERLTYTRNKVRNPGRLILPGKVESFFASSDAYESAIEEEEARGGYVFQIRTIKDGVNFGYILSLAFSLCLSVSVCLCLCLLVSVSLFNTHSLYVYMYTLHTYTGW